MTHLQDSAPTHRKPGRNEPCSCKSGRKYKVCCGSASNAQRSPPEASVQPRSTASHSALAHAGQAIGEGRPLDAIAVLRQACTRDAKDSGLQRELGRLLLGIGRPNEALPCLDRAVALNPKDSQARLQQGVALEQLGWAAQAAEAYRQAISLKPRSAEAHARLGIVLLIQDMRAAAAEAFKSAASLEPRSSIGRLSEAYGLLAHGAWKSAQASLQRLTTIEPNNAPAHVELGKLLAEMGDAANAAVAFKRALRLNPRAAGHYYDLVRIGPLGESGKHLLQQMAQAQERTDLPELQRVMLELALGKAHDDLGDPEQAMRYYVCANQRKARMRPLDRSAFSALIDWQIRNCTAARLAQPNDARLSDVTPLVIVGMPRSGTTLVESILARHPDVGAGEELPFWGRQGRQVVSRNAWPERAEVAELSQAYAAVLRSVSAAPHVTDKKPDNFIWAGLIHWVYPQARVVHCRRGALDTCTSILANFFAPRPDFSADPDDLVFYFREYERLMAHWRVVLPSDRFMEIEYEALVTDPDAHIRRLIAFCGLPWDDVSLHPEGSTRRISTASLWQARQPIFQTSVGRWQRYQAWLGPLNALVGPP